MVFLTFAVCSLTVHPCPLSFVCVCIFWNRLSLLPTGPPNAALFPPVAVMMMRAARRFPHPVEGPGSHLPVSLFRKSQNRFPVQSSQPFHPLSGEQLQQAKARKQHQGNRDALGNAGTMLLRVCAKQLQWGSHPSNYWSKSASNQSLYWIASDLGKWSARSPSSSPMPCATARQRLSSAKSKTLVGLDLAPL